MATEAPANSKRVYSGWWNSHIGTKNSKWLQENLTDMDAKVKQIIKLLEEDADSFARRAEMYYKRRPELMKLVEEFYRTYRSLAERYDHATGMLRQAHRTMAEAFPNQVPLMLGDESPAGSATEGGPQTPDVSPILSQFDPDELQKDSSGMSYAVRRNVAFTEEFDTVTGRKGMKQFNDLLGSGRRARKGLNFQDAESQELGVKTNGNHDLKAHIESEQLNKAKLEISTLKDALSKLEAKKEAAHLQYQQTLERLSYLESEVSRTKEDSKGLSEQARKAKEEVQILKDALAKLENEREAGFVKCQQYEDKISNLEISICQAQKDAAELNKRAGKAEIEGNSLKQDLARLEAEKESALLQYKQCLVKISYMEDKLLHAEADARKSTERAEKAEKEVENLKQTLGKLTEEKEAAAVQYLHCLERIVSLECKLAVAQEETQKLKSEIDDGVAKFKDAEERCLLLERSNQHMHSELESLSQKMAAQSEELTEKQQELGRIWNSLQEERLRFVEAETAFQTLQHLHSQSQDELRSLAAEFQKRNQMLVDLEAYNQNLQNEVEQIKGENKGLNEVNLSSALTIQDLQAEILQLRETIGKLETEVELRVDQRNALQQEIYCLKEELNDLNKNHQALLGRVESVGWSPDSFVSHVKDLLDENTQLRKDCERDRAEKIALLEKLSIMDKLLEKNALLENSLSDLNVELESVRDKVKVLEESCQSLLGEKSSLVNEKSTLVSQLQIASDNLKEVMEKNNSLEKSLLDAHSELEGLQVKSKSLEESCLLLENEKSDVAAAKESLILQLGISQKSLKSLNASYRELDEKHSSLEKERESMLQEVEGLKISLDAEKQVREIMDVRFKNLEDSCLLLENEKSDLATAKESLILQLDISQKSLESLKASHKELEERHLSLEEERESIFHEVEGLRVCLGAEKQEHANLVQRSESQLAGMALEISKLQEEVWRKSYEYDAELDKAVNAQTEIFVLQESIQDFEEKNFGLLLECQKLMETSKLSNKLISELEQENLEQQMEAKSLFDQIKVLRVGLYHVLKTLDADQWSDDKAKEDKILLCLVLNKLQEAQGFLFELQDENQKLAIENSLLVTLIRELQLEVANVATAKHAVDQEFSTKCKQLLLLQTESQKLTKMNEELRLSLKDREQKEEAVKDELRNLRGQLLDLHGAHQNLQDEKCKVLDEKRSLLKLVSDLRVEKHILEEEYSVIFEETLFQSTLSMIFTDTVTERSMALKELGDNLDKLLLENDKLKENVTVMKGKLDEIDAMKVERAELIRMVEDLRCKYEGVEVIRADQATQIMKLTGDMDQQRQEAESAREANQKMEFELRILQGESQQAKCMIDRLNNELQNREKEVDVWESEAEALFDKLQISTFQATLLEGKIHELAEMYGKLEERNHTSAVEIDQLKERVGTLDVENDKLKENVTVMKGKMDEIDAMKVERAELIRLVEVLQCKYEEVEVIRADQATQIMKLTGDTDQQRQEVESAREANQKMEFKLQILQGESQQAKCMIDRLKNELQNRAKEVDVWESEAEALFDKLQISAFQATLLEGKIHELAELYGKLEDRNHSSAVEIDQLKERVGTLDVENDKLKENVTVMKGKLDEIDTMKVARAELIRLVEDLRCKYEGVEVIRADQATQILKLTGDTDQQRQEVESAREANRKMEIELQILQGEFQQAKCMIDRLNSELQNRAKEVDVWESEAEALFDKLQISAFQATLLEGKIHELAEMFGKLEDRNHSSAMEIDQLKERVGTLDVENDKLKENATVMKGKLDEIDTMKVERAELIRLVEDLRCKYEGVEVIRADQATQIMKLTGDTDQQRQEVESAREANQKMEFELQILQVESQQAKCMVDRLNNELQNRAKEVAVWESEAEALFDKLQISAFQATLLEGKIHELAEMYGKLEDRNHSSAGEIDQLKERVGALVVENEELIAQLTAYATAFISLKDSVTTVEKHTVLHVPLHEDDNLEAKDASIVDVESHQHTSDEQSALVPGAPLDLLELRTRIKAIEKAIVEKERLLVLENSIANSKLLAAMRQIEELKSGINLLQSVGASKPANAYLNDKEHGPGLQKHAHEISEEGSEVITKDIMLDQISESSPHGISRREILEADDPMLEMWETANQDESNNLNIGKTRKVSTAVSEKKHSREHLSIESLGEKELSFDKLEISKNFSGSRQEGSERKILERLDSDVQKLTNLEITVQDLKRKVEVADQNRKGKGIEYDSVKEQLEESEEAITKLLDVNRKLKKTVEDEYLSFDEKSALASDQAGIKRRRKISEQARRGSEKIGRLQLEVQKLQVLLAKLDDENNNKAKVKSAEREKRVLLRDYLYSGTRTGPMRKKGHFCSCVQPATKED